MRTASRLLAAVLFLFPAAACAGLDEAVAYSNRHGGQALIIWQAGKVLWESSRANQGLTRDENIYSITKSVAALAVLQAAGRGKFSLDEPISLTLPEFRKDPRKRAITVRQLLSQTSGLATGYDALYATGLRNKLAVALRIPDIAPAGTVFAYGPSHYEVLEIFLAKKLRRPAFETVTQSLLQPLGIRADGWRRDRLGTAYFSAGARLSARDLLALGHLVRRHGWQGIFPLVSPALIREATKGSDANPMYGLGFWLNHQATISGAEERDIEEALSAGLTRAQWARSCVSHMAPSDLTVMAGSRGQRVYVSRTRKLVIVRLGNAPGFRDPDFLRAYFRAERKAGDPADGFYHQEHKEHQGKNSTRKDPPQRTSE